MKKKKGFTIIELIVSITILTIIVLVVGVNFNKIFDNREKQSYDEYVNKIKSATDLYLSNNITLTSELNTNKSYVRISLKELKESGLIGEDLKNPVSGSIPDDKELVLVSLDETGAYKFTYPSVEVEAHLQTLNKIVDYNSTFDCLADLDTINLGLVDKDGNLVKDYFKNNPSNITCKTLSIDTKSIGNQVVKYSYILDGVTKEATRNYVVIDSIYPTVTNISQNPTAWTKNTVTITANINDYESGIAAYAINLDKCGNLVSTTNNQITSVVSQNGTYSVCAKDIYGNVKEEKINITNIDKTAPEINNSKQFTVGLGITATIVDNQSRLVAYAINTSSNASAVSWTNISATTSRNISQAVSKIGTHYIWAKDAVGNVSKKAITVVDNIKPKVTNVKGAPTAWTNGNVTISANISDNESGIASYAINLNNCGSYTSTTASSVSKAVSANGTYSVCAKDKTGNFTESKITISNIDKTLPAITVSKSTTAYVTSLTINGTITDSGSRIVAWAINTSSSASSVSWSNISATTSRNVSMTVTSNGTYYVWGKDAAGNVSSRSIVINNIGTLRTVSFWTGELSSRSYSSNYNTGYSVKAIVSVTTDTGSVSSSSISGTRVYYSLSGGRSYEGSYWSTCTYSATYRRASEDEDCTRYSCPSGGDLSGSRCTGRTYNCTGYNYYKCSNGSWVADGWTNNCSSNAPSGYSYRYNGCGSRPTGSCTSGSRSVKCTATYSWRGNYNATCTRSTTIYSCPSGYERSGTSCYKCDSGDRLSGSTCRYDCRKYYDYYEYHVTINYIT